MSRTSLLLKLVITLAVLVSVTVIVRIWGVAFTDDIVMAKLLSSYFISGIMASFAVIILVDYSGNKTKKLLVSLFILGELLGLLALVQIWAQLFEWWTFARVAGSLAVAILLAGFIMAAIEDFDEDKDLKKKNYLD